DDDTSSSTGDNSDKDSAADLDYTAANSASWRKYSLKVAQLLQQDASTLYDSWNVSYKGGNAFKNTFKAHNGAEGYSNVMDCITTIIDKCNEITDEVGNTKIGDPYNKWNAGQQTEALYAVESWYSYHSRDDYANNIRSIRNSYFNSLDSTINDKSLYRVMERVNPTLNTQISNAIEAAKNAILAIPQPFRNHINDEKVPPAMEACVDLGNLFNKDLRNALTTAYNNGTISDDDLNNVIDEYVDKVIMPTYKDLQDKTVALTQAVQNFYNTPSNDTFESACEAWLVARTPWEQSEAFLFGPVDVLGLDPNMDSWPLDQVAIVNILNSGNFDNLNWNDGDTEEEITQSQEVRGFHTLEFLLFKNGNPRTVPAE
ncbi:MAG: peptidase M75, partial [Paraprevotella sp.]|nr:peptidase M75 [Paraprevotella sp.]